MKVTIYDFTKNCSFKFEGQGILQWKRKKEEKKHSKEALLVESEAPGFI